MILQDKKNHSQKGIALITVMLMMAIMTILSVTMFNTSTVESLISSNYRTSKEAFFDADAGVHYALARINEELKETENINLAWLEEKVEDLNDELENEQNNTNSGLHGFSFFYPVDEIEELEPGKKYCFKSFGTGSNNAGAHIESCFEVSSRTHPAFYKGILSDGSINFNGNANLTGGQVHANNSEGLDSAISVDLQANGPYRITSNVIAYKGRVDVSGAGFTGTSLDNSNLEENEPERVAKESVPRVSSPAWSNDDIRIEQDENGNEIKKWKTTDKEVVELTDSSTISGEHTDKVFLVSGSVTIDNSGDLKNVTIISTNDITFQGRSRNDGDIHKNAFIALGDITFNGASDSSYAVFWCNGNFINNGASKIIGSIVAGGDITRNGVTNYEYDDTVDNDNLAQTYSAEAIEWKDLSLSS